MKSRSLRGEIGVVTPCMNCENRYATCHSECQSYASYKVEREKVRKQQEEYEDIDIGRRKR